MPTLRPQERRFLRMRLQNQGLAVPVSLSALEVLDWMGPIQAQDFDGALWALACRSSVADASEIECQYNDGSILRTHLLRPTWHFVLSRDLAWTLELCGSQVRAQVESQMRREGMDSSLLRRARRVIVKALEAEEHLSRDALLQKLSHAKIHLKGNPLALLLIHLESDAILCSGPRLGRKISYALFERRVPPRRSISKMEALGRLAFLYFRGRAPASLRDFEWWSGLNVAMAREALELMKPKLERERYGEEDYYFFPTPSRSRRSRLWLLPNYDEALLAYQDRRASLRQLDPSKLDARGQILFQNLIFQDGEVLGVWKARRKKNELEMTTTCFQSPNPGRRKAIRQEGERYAKFWGLRLAEEGGKP